MMRDERLGCDETWENFAKFDSDEMNTVPNFLIKLFIKQSSLLLDEITAYTFQNVLENEGYCTFKLDRFVYKNTIEPIEKLKYAAVTTFRNICPITFRMLYFILMTEHSIVILSKHYGILSSLMFILFHLVTPFLPA